MIVSWSLKEIEWFCGRGNVAVEARSQNVDDRLTAHAGT